MRFLLLALTLSFTATSAHARLGKCGDRHLPSDKIRKLRNVRLECTSTVDHYVRTAVPFDYSAWRKADRYKDREEMQAVGQKAPIPAWNGTLVYKTIERWEWTSKRREKNEAVCGSTSYTTKDKDGKDIVVKVINECDVDYDESESRHCSTESMPYEAIFVRPDPKTQYGPKVPGITYYDVLPDIFTLLPGEVEDVQVFNTSRESVTLSPTVEVGDAWNEYRAETTIAGHGATAPCEMGRTYRLAVKVHTIKRREKETPNAFRNPVNKWGREIEPIADWYVALGEGGKEIRVKPRLLRFTDASEVMILAFARMSRKYESEIAEAKDEAGEGRSTPVDELKEFQRKMEEEDKENPTGFWKDTRIRLRLYRTEFLARDVKQIANYYTDGSVASMDDKGQYAIPLDNAWKGAGPHVPEFWKQFEVGLVPGAKYSFYVSMYQKGVPFYKQDCDDPKNKGHFNCRFGFAGERNWYSKELPVDFLADKNFDERSPIQKLSNWQNKSTITKIADFIAWVF